MTSRPEAETEDDDFVQGGRSSSAAPGLLVVFEVGAPTLRAIALSGEPARIGRDRSCEIPIDDTLASRVHAEVSLADGAVVVRDLKSRNGTFVDGAKVSTVTATSPRAIRVGGTVLTVVDDVRPFVNRRVRVEDGMVIGPSTHRTRVALADAARRGKTCLITGESGTGKDAAARHYHASSAYASGPCVVVNCAAIARELAESELFGATKGAHSTALADKAGYFGAAHGGVLFLDEIGTLDLALQAKLLRAVETKEITPLGSTTPKRIDMALCAATNADLDDDASRGAFRMDLLQRIRQVEIALAPLRERPDELAHLVELAAKRANASAVVSASLVEACLLRAFRGTNVRGLASAVDSAAITARDDGRDAIVGADLPKPKPSDAWEHIVSDAAVANDGELLSDRERRAQAVIHAYRELGNVDEAARLAGVGRSTAYEILKRHRR